MLKRYVLFVDEEQLRVLRAGARDALDWAIHAGKTELAIPLAGLMNQLSHPREMRERNQSLFTQVKEQVLGK